MTLDSRTALIISLVVIIALLSTCKSCGDRVYEKRIAELELNLSASKEDNPIIVKRIDTIAYRLDTQYIPKPYAYIPKGYFKLGGELVMNTTLLSNTGRPTYVLTTDSSGNIISNDTAGNDYFPPTTFNDVQCDDKLVYLDTLRSSSGYVAVTDTVTGNQIVSRQVSWNIKTTNTTNTITNTVRKPMLYLGVDGYGNSDGINGFGLNLMYSSPRALNYELGVVAKDGSNINYKAGIKIPLGKK